MKETARKIQNRKQRQYRVRAVINGTTDRPRLSVHVSNHNIVAQVIDDTKQTTLVYVTTVGQKVDGKTMTERALWVGEQLGKKATQAKIKTVVFDRGSHLYHGRIKALADKAREAGLEF